MAFSFLDDITLSGKVGGGGGGGGGERRDMPPGSTVPFQLNALEYHPPFKF